MRRMAAAKSGALGSTVSRCAVKHRIHQHAAGLAGEEAVGGSGEDAGRTALAAGGGGPYHGGAAADEIVDDDGGAAVDVAHQRAAADHP
jgi:hypothetical protein